MVKVIGLGEVKRKKKLVKYYDAQEGICYLCGGDMTLSLGFNNTAEVEHIVPKANQDVKGPYNEAAAGHACNRYKGKRPLYEVATKLRELKLCENNVPNAGALALRNERKLG